MSAIKISVVIPTIGRLAELKKLFSSLQAQDFSQDEFEVVVISQAYLSEVADLLQSFDFCYSKYLQSNKRGVNVSRNIGLSCARGEVIYFLDDDCELIHPKQLHIIYHQLQLSERLAAIGGPYVLDARPGRIEVAYHTIAMAWYEHHVLNGIYTDQLLGGNAAYRAELVKNIKFDERIAFGGAEEEFNHSICSREFLMISDRALAVRHHLRMSISDLIRKAFLQGFWSGERHTRHIFTGHMSDSDFLRHLPPDKMTRALIAIYRFVFGYAHVLQGERRWSKSLQIFIKYFYQKLIIETLYEKAMPFLIWKVFWPALVRVYVFVAWGILWRATYPFRKMYYFFSYQWQTRVSRPRGSN